MNIAVNDRLLRTTASLSQIEEQLESTRRLVRAIWLMGQFLMETDEDYDPGPVIKQLAEEVEDHLKALTVGVGLPESWWPSVNAGLSQD
jgi:hypothetical protein